MGYIIRIATASDAPKWLDLVKATLGPDYVAKELYDLEWISSQLNSETGHETWVVEDSGSIECSVSLLKPVTPAAIINLGRDLYRPGSLTNGYAEALLAAITKTAASRNQMIVGRVSATDNPLQLLYENQGYSCVGFQPLKHLQHQRDGILFYVHGVNSLQVTRAPISDSLPQIGELATAVLESLHISNSLSVRDGATGYPLQTNVKIQNASSDEYELWLKKAHSSNPPVEVSGKFNLGFGRMRLPTRQPVRALLGQDNDQVVSGLKFYFDEQDRCARITEAFACDQFSMGALVAQVLKIAQEQLGAVYTEIDILATAPRLLKSAEQMGFVPVAYFPAFHILNGVFADVVKLVKLNLPYSIGKGDFTTHARSVMEIINRNFEDQKVGLGLIKLLQQLAMFEGLGDGDLRKMARLFTQKLFRPGEQIFALGDSSDEAYVVLRGQIDISLDRGAPPIASLSNGKIFGELAFLDGVPRNAFAVATQPSILLVVKRNDFINLIRHEPALGMVVMRNIAHDLSLKLRSASLALAAAQRQPSP